MNQIQSFLEQITFTQVATWALVVLVAGFIGQFGRKFAEYLIERAKRKKIQKQLLGNETGKQKPVEAEKTDTLPAVDDLGDSTKEAKEISKQKKKAAKALTKQAKKS